MDGMKAIESSTEHPKKQYKTPDYVRRAKNNYHKRKKESDPEYIEKIYQKKTEWLQQKKQDPEFLQKYKDTFKKYQRDKFKTSIEHHVTEKLATLETTLKKHHIDPAALASDLKSILFDDDMKGLIKLQYECPRIHAITIAHNGLYWMLHKRLAMNELKHCFPKLSPDKHHPSFKSIILA